MSHFKCPECDSDILEDGRGYYVTGCAHYPIEPQINNAPIRLATWLADRSVKELAR